MRNRALSWGTGISFAGLALGNVCLLAIRSAEPGQYFDRGDPGISSWKYPIFTVVGVSLLILMEAAVLWLVLFSPGAPARWRRAVLGILLTIPPAFLALVMNEVHEPAYEMIHTAWLFELTVIAIVTLVIAGAGVLVSRLRTKTAS